MHIQTDYWCGSICSPSYSRPLEIAEGWSRIQCDVVAGETDQDGSAVVRRSVMAVQREIAYELAMNTTEIIVSGKCTHNET